MPDSAVDKPTTLRITTEILEWLAGPELAETRHLHSFWQKQLQDGLAHLKDFTKPELTHLLRYTIIWEPIGPWLDARVRLMGQALQFRFGADITGHKMSEVFSHLERPQHIRMLRHSMQQNKPTFIKSSLRSEGREIMSLEVFTAPVLDDDNGCILAMVNVQPYPLTAR